MLRATTIHRTVGGGRGLSARRQGPLVVAATIGSLRLLFRLGLETRAVSVVFFDHIADDSSENDELVEPLRDVEANANARDAVLACDPRPLNLVMSQIDLQVSSPAFPRSSWRDADVHCSSTKSNRCTSIFTPSSRLSPIGEPLTSS